MTQGSLGFAAARARRDEGMARVEEHADSEWLDRAFRTLAAYLRTNAEFFVDDFWARSGLERPGNSKAIGPVIRRAAKAGLMRRTDRCRPSIASNLAVKPIWESLVFGGGSSLGAGGRET